MLDDKNSLAIIRSIISVSNNLDFTVTAEGIETSNQASVLKYLGCNTLQGYFFSKPVGSQEILSLANKHWHIQETEHMEIFHETK
jgi:EAL domain-containing protein (putative c-di-GMP-specific phosphodiesterase class I)